MVTLGDVADLRAGFGFPTSLQGRSSGDFPFAKVGDISRAGRAGRKRVSTADNYVDEGDLTVLKAKPVPKDSVLFAKIGEAIRQNHRAIADRDMLIDNNAMAAVPRDSIDPGYLYRFLQTVDLYNYASSTTVPSLRKSELVKIPVPLPSSAEQQRIVAILDHSDALRAKRREALTRLDELTQSIFVDMFGDPTREHRWQLLRFGDVCHSRLGKMLDKKAQTGDHVRPYLRNANVQWFHIDTTDLLEMDFDEKSRREFRLEPGDILMCEGGEPGRAAIWREPATECYYQKALHRIRPNQALLTPEYLVRLFWFLAKGGGLNDHVTAATIAHLTGAKLKEMKIPVPPLDLQRQFEQRVTAAESHKAQLRTALAELDALFASLQSRAFRGEL